MMPKLTPRFLIILMLALSFGLTWSEPAVAQACEYWVAPEPEGNNENPGSFSQPWATIRHAADNVSDSYCTVWFKEGEYFGNYRLNRRFNTTTIFKSVIPYRAILQNNGAVINISGGRNITLEGFIFQHSGPEAASLVLSIDRSKEGWAEWITLRNNIIHDSYNNDLVKLHNGARFVTIEGNIFYNQGDGEQHLDVNSVTDVYIQDNIFFNDFAGSGRVNTNNTKHFIIIKDSNENADGLEGSERINVRRNIFLNWEGGSGETLVQVGNDGKPYHEAKDIRIENNLIIGNASNKIGAAFGVRGAKDVFFVNNTVTGNLPSSAYAFWVSLKDLNPTNENIYFYNNIWSDSTGTMGADLSGGSNKFSNGNPTLTNNLILDNNLYWNGGKTIPHGDLVSPVFHDKRRVVKDPQLNTNHEAIILPRWNGSAFLSGKTTIREEFIRLVELFSRIPEDSSAIGEADPAFSPADDILRRPRTGSPSLGAFEYRPVFGWHLYVPIMNQSSPNNQSWLCKILGFGR